MTETEAPSPSSTRRRLQALQVVASWLVISALSTALRWNAVESRTFRDPDDGMRLVQVRDLVGGQSWWDLTQSRLGADGLELHWSRHMDALLGAVIVALRPLVSEATAELVAIVAVPLALLLATLWLISSIAERLVPSLDAGFFALVIVSFAILPLLRITPGALDHHGLQLVLMLLLVRAVLDTDSKRWAIAAGVAAGVSLTVALETLPIVAAILAMIGLQWAITYPRPRFWYRICGSTLVLSVVGSAVVFSHPSGLLSRECDVMSAGFLGLVAIPALGLAAVGGAEVPARSRWGALAAMGAGGLAWFASTTPQCAAGPYGDLPDLAMRVWIDRIAEVAGLFDRFADAPLFGLFLCVGPVAALVTLAWLVKSEDRLDLLPFLSALVVVVALGVWQTRALISGQALAAPVLGLATAMARQRVSNVSLRVVVTFLLIISLSGFTFLFLNSIVSQSAGRDGPGAGVTATCTTPELLAGLDALEPGLVSAEMDIAAQLLLHTEHRVMAANLHRGYAGVLAAYEIAGARPADAAETARKHDVDYVIVCFDSSTSNSWREDHPNGLHAHLLLDEPPAGFRKVVQSSGGRVYAVEWSDPLSA